MVSIGSGPLTKQEPLDAFQKAYPKIQVTTVRGRGSQLGSRIIAERRAARYLVDLVNRAPHPNAAKVFINWLLSREGQIEIQKGGRARSDQYDSLRMDIPKDIPEDVRRKEGVTYFDSDDPRFADRTPVDKLLREILK